jgi:casein kinase II subunit alpha
MVFWRYGKPLASFPYLLTWLTGLQLISLIWGRNFHIFKPVDVSADDEEFPAHVLIQQARYFGLFPLSYETFLDDEQERILAAIHIYIEEQDTRKPFELVEDEEITSEDKVFLCDVMQLDPMERPTAKGLLKHRWFGMP